MVNQSMIICYGKKYVVALVLSTRADELLEKAHKICLAYKNSLWSVSSLILIRYLAEYFLNIVTNRYYRFVWG